MTHSKGLGLAATTVGVLLLIGIFWGFGIFANWPTNFFSSSSEDLIKDVYTTSYHVAYDDDATQCRAMNYPYGEYYTFTGLQPLVAMPLQALRDLGVEHPERAVLPLMNLMIFLSIVLCAVFLFLLFHELRLPTWYAVAGALLVTLMSPQLERMGGHLSLSYYCAIPMLLYFTLRHLRSGCWVWSALCGLFCLLFSLSHPYYLMFYFVVSVAEHIYLFSRRSQNGWSIVRIGTSFAMQTVVPLLLFLLFTNIGLQPGERTAVPSGFHTYRGRIVGILFPYGRMYFMNDSHLFSSVQWEGRNYIGLLADVVLFVVLYRFVRNLLRRRFRQSIRPTDSRELNFFLAVATVFALFACGFPFQWLPHNTVSYCGPLAQLRAQGRFVWLFYYVINIVAVYQLFQWSKELQVKWRVVLMSAVFLLFAGEATAFNWHNRDWFVGKWEEWTDYDNQLPVNKSLQQLNKDEYQAILTLPVFNVGSELVYISQKDNMFVRSALLSMKTGLPLVCNESARSVIRQAWDCIAISRPAWVPLEYAGNLPDSRPLLLAVSLDSTILSDAEKLFLKHAEPIMEWNGAMLYSLPLEAFQEVEDETAEQMHQMYRQALEEPVDAVVENRVLVSGDIHKHLTIFDSTVNISGDVEISFWMDHILDDQYSRTTIHFKAYDADGNCTDLFNWGVDPLIYIVNTSTNEGLIRLNAYLPDSCQRLRIEARNSMMRPSPVSFHSLLVRPADKHVAFSYAGKDYIDNIPLPSNLPYVRLRGGRFVVNGETWFPMMINYKAFMNKLGDSLEVVPAGYYRQGSLREHFDTIASWGFNAVRVCLDVLEQREDTAAMFRATRRMVQQADSAGLRVMLLIKPPFETYWQSYTEGLLRALADLPALWAYDFMNEPLYFDPEPERDKLDAVETVNQWRKMVRRFAPNQLFTVATAEPIEVFEWDPSMLPVDFIEMHTYHPLRVKSEMWWYSSYCRKPWIVGETGLPADNISVPYDWQVYFLWETYRYAKITGAIGYGWWEFGDCPEGVNFEAQYTGLRDTAGVRKPAASMVGYCGKVCLGMITDEDVSLPVNYYNMLAYSNIRLSGRVVDEKGRPVEGAVIRGWNDDWSVGMNTFSDHQGRFTLYSNDYNVHFEVSAPGMTRKKFDKRNIRYSNPKGVDTKNLPDMKREYQQIDFGPYMKIINCNMEIANSKLPSDLKLDSSYFNQYSLSGELGTVKLSSYRR